MKAIAWALIFVGCSIPSKERTYKSGELNLGDCIALFSFVMTLIDIGYGV